MQLTFEPLHIALQGLQLRFVGAARDKTA
eukprot:SAG11_NODE_2335_length_3504_cov_2.100734_5_plen_28_part_01